MRVLIEMTGTSPLLCHNEQLASPSNSWARAIAELTSKSEKTPEDHSEIARLEFMGGLYIGKQGPMIPTANIHRCLVEAAKVRREGRKVERGLIPTAMEIPLEYDGPRDPAQLWADERFRYMSMVKIGKSKISRMRPRFIDWKLVSEWELLTDVMDLDRNLVRITAESGLIEGLGDGRKKGFGRFVGVARAAAVTPLKKSAAA